MEKQEQEKLEEIWERINDKLNIIINALRELSFEVRSQ
jgi:hypothetical protein